MGRVLALLAVLACSLPGEPAAGQPQVPLRALVLDHPDPWTKATGAAVLLEKAGFEVHSLSLTQSPKFAPAELIVIGSFASEHPGYAKYMKSHGRSLAAWVRRGGVILQFTQADQTEAGPPFLPVGLEAFRGDADFGTLIVLEPDHPLLEGLPISGKEEKRLGLGNHLRRPPNWESLAWQKGFRVLVASDKLGRNPALMEGAAGEGRVLLTSLFLDKVLDAGGKPLAAEPWLAVSERFFENLEPYVRRVAMGEAPPVPPSIHPDAVKDDLEPGGPVALGWGLAPSDFAHYERLTVTRKGEREFFGRSLIRTVHGHDLRDAGQYLPISPRRGELETILAFRLPPPGETSGEFTLDLGIAKITEVRVKGNVASFELGPDTALVEGEYTFGSRGRHSRSETHQIHGGKATVQALFDRKEGVFRSARVRIAYIHRKIDARPEDKVGRVDAEYEIRLKELKRTRYPDFQKDVDAAIDKGVAYLRTLRRKDGTFKPHGNWVFGTTALATFTLVSCDVPRTDPEIEATIAWMCGQEPNRTYEQATGLMAMDRAYAPAWEIARERRGEQVPLKRDLPPDRRAWCERTASALEKACRSPGVWSYSGKGNRLLLQFDSSNTQYAILGLRAASRLGLETKEQTWLGVIQYFEQVRERKGKRGTVRLVHEGEKSGEGESVVDTRVPAVAGFRYSTLDSHRPAWGSMTCAGIASLAIARDQLVRLTGGPLPARRNREIEDLMLSGWGWLDRHWAIDRHPLKPGDNWYFYYLYNLERAGVLTRVRLVGGKDWYFEGAVQLLARQKKNGSWNERGGGDITETCFALLFLKRATAPLTPSGR